MWYKERYDRITASNAKAYCGSKQNPGRLIVAVLQRQKPSGEKVPFHMRYRLENEDKAVEMYLKQSTDKVSVRKCGLFVDKEHAQLAASPDGTGLLNDQQVILEVKCLSASRSQTPWEAVVAKQKVSQFAFKCVNNANALKEKTPILPSNTNANGYQWRESVYCHHFTNEKSPVGVVHVNFDFHFWKGMKEKLLHFHAAYIVPTLVNVAYKLDQFYSMNIVINVFSQNWFAFPAIEDTPFMESMIVLFCSLRHV